MSKDYYSTLGVDKGANQAEIKSAFRKKAHEYHPDKKTGDEAKFKEINEAYQTLGNEQKRKQYDQFGSGFENMGGFSGGQGFGGGQGFSGINMDDLGDMFSGFGDIFGGGSQRRRGPARGNDLEMVMSISFEEAIFGLEKSINFKKKVICDKCSGNGAEPGSAVETCKTCNGSGVVRKMQRTILGTIQTEVACSECDGEGKTYSKKCSKCSGHGLVIENVELKVKIPEGINNGESIRLSGQGEAGDPPRANKAGGQAGDLYLRIRVTPSRKFVRDGYDILNEKIISFTQAALGGKIDIETVHGDVSLKISEGTQSDTTFKLKGKGSPILNGRGKGDHLVKIIVKIPTGLSKAQKDKIKDLNI